MLKAKETQMSFSTGSRFPLALIALIAMAALATACSKPVDRPGADVGTGMDSLVSAEWLSQHLDDPDLVVLDCSVSIEPDGTGGFRIASGRAKYESGHIPTAGFADLMGDLSDGESELRFAVPGAEQFAAAMSALGVGNDSKVVLYDTSNSAWAARVWWMLRWIGFDRAALLDGGLAAWIADGRPLSTEPASPVPGKLTVKLRPELIVGRDEVLAAIQDDSASIIDALSEAQYRGEMSMYARPGHITGASNVPMTSLMDETGRYRPQAELDVLFEGDPDTRAITYCGGGIAASANAFVLTRLGYKDVAVYTASLQEWAADPSLPMEVAPDLKATDE
jgi:thiosulfate/3-mercaptopyruvate sulfurtransferase